MKTRLTCDSVKTYRIHLGAITEKSHGDMEFISQIGLNTVY